MNEKTSKTNDKIVQIKKYANRRLYNMQTSSYITLDDLANLVKEDVIFVVKDAKTDADLTGQVLMQIVLEQEASGSEVVPVELLRSIIRYYDTNIHQSFSHYLTQSMQFFTQNKQNWFKGLDGLGGADLEMMQKQQIEWFNQTMKMMNPLR